MNVDMGVVLCNDDKDQISTPDKDEGTEYDIVQSDDFVLSCFWKISRPAGVTVDPWEFVIHPGVVSVVGGGGST